MRNFAEDCENVLVFFLPPTSDGHNFLIQTPFWVFLDSMESLLSQESSHVPLEGNWYSQLCRKLIVVATLS